MDLQRTSDSESKEVEDVMPSLSSPALVCQPGSCLKKPMELGALQFGNSTSRSQVQEGSHNSIVPYFNPAQDDSSRILSWLGNNQLITLEEQHSESETTIQDNYIVDMDSISSGANFQSGTLIGGSNSYPPAQVVINVAVPTDSGAQNPTEYQWLKISKLLIPVSAGAVYNTSSMFAKAANTLAFIATLTAISLRPTRSRAIRISTKFAAIACAAGTLAAVGHDLPDDYRWASGVAYVARTRTRDTDTTRHRHPDT